ncbi:MAG: XRE family transcriptional regulator [Brevinema sp.]
MDIKNIRESMDMTQTEFAGRLGVTKSYISLIENGKQEPSRSIIKKITDLQELIKVDNLTCNIELPFIDIQASAGYGFMNFEDFPITTIIKLPIALLGITDNKDMFIIKVKGNSMSPKIEDGDLLLVRHMPNMLRYMEGIHIVNYDGELYVKDIQLTEQKLIMRSINKDYEDIIIPSIEETDCHIQILARVIKSIKIRNI